MGRCASNKRLDVLFFGRVSLQVYLGLGLSKCLQPLVPSDPGSSAESVGLSSASFKATDEGGGGDPLKNFLIVANHHFLEPREGHADQKRTMGLIVIVLLTLTYLFKSGVSGPHSQRAADDDPQSGHSRGGSLECAVRFFD
jgi:hypothetical protein